MHHLRRQMNELMTVLQRGYNVNIAVNESLNRHSRQSGAFIPLLNPLLQGFIWHIEPLYMYLELLGWKSTLVLSLLKFCHYLCKAFLYYSDLYVKHNLNNKLWSNIQRKLRNNVLHFHVRQGLISTIVSPLVIFAVYMEKLCLSTSGSIFLVCDLTLLCTQPILRAGLVNVSLNIQWARCEADRCQSIKTVDSWQLRRVFLERL